LIETVDDGRTGFLINGSEDLAGAMLGAGTLDRAACHAAARARFSLDPMISAYLEMYRRLASGRAGRAA
jgi:hypothetical protein